SYSLLVLLEKLNAKERAVFILKESFDYPHDEIAAILSITEEHSRKLLSRAKDKLFKPGAAAGASIRDARTNTPLQNYIDAIRDRNMQRLEGLLAADIAFYADGGPNVNVVKRICTGSAAVADLVTLVYQRFQEKSTIRFTEVNHQPALLFYFGDRLNSCLVF